MFEKKTDTVLLSDTLSGKREFAPLKKGEVRMYSCGPTVYGPQHIGNLRAAVFSDTVARTMAVAGYAVKRVVNITDVGHLVGDGDEGEDKMAVGAAREKVSPMEIADKYAKQYLTDVKALNVDTRRIRFPRATAYVQDQIQMIKTLEKKGHTYTLPDGVYFDTATFPDYGKLGKRNEAKLEAGARVAMVEGKKNPQDFVLWRTAKPNDLQKWKSPWGVGNPGWSIECSAMIRALLGKTIDIHTGGEDHISIHHNNEIAQSEGANGAPLAHYWLHNAFLTIDGEKISKSLGNTYVLDDIVAKGYHPLALRYLFLQAHYKTPLSFTWESLKAADEALSRLWKTAREIRVASGRKSAGSRIADDMREVARDDLGTPQTVALLHSALQNAGLSSQQKWGALMAADELLGLSLTNPPEEPKVLTMSDLPSEAQEIAKKREEARKNKDYAASDELRIHLEKSGYRVEDGPSGTTYTKKQG